MTDAENARCITICGKMYRLEDPNQSEEDIQDAMEKGVKITILVAYNGGGLDPEHFYLEGRLTIDPNHPCGRLTTHARVKAGKLPWPG